jgi:hypothetical protein
MYFTTVILYNRRSFKYLLKVGVELERTMDQLFKSNLTFCVVCVFTLLLEKNLNEHPILYK